MKASDYIVEYLIDKGITDIFGYPGGMVTHLMDSLSKYQDTINSHITYNEQGAAMAACGYAQISGKTGVAYATSGPGATNLITGICNAYMDSVPVLFITGQVNSFEQKGNLKVRQRGFQETDIVSMVSTITKFAVQINSADELKQYLDYAFYIANEGRKGPVLLDIAMDVTRAEINPTEQKDHPIELYQTKGLSLKDVSLIKDIIQTKSRPVLLLGNGLSRDQLSECGWKRKLFCLGIPVVSSMIAVDIQPEINNYYGFIGAYGNRAANFVIAKSDLVVAVGARLDIRQVGANREHFASKAVIIRIDIDAHELEYPVHENEIGICADASAALNSILDVWSGEHRDYAEWIDVCNQIKSNLSGIDDKKYNKFVTILSDIIPSDSVITTDVGQNQVWVAQSFRVKKNQRILFSGGHGAMGYSLPAAIGACFAANGKPVYSFNGDGGIQMNIQELQTIARDNLPVKVIIFNNNSLGMIRHFQEMYFDGNYYQTTSTSGFTSPDFQKLADAYQMKYALIKDFPDISSINNLLSNNDPAIIEVQLAENTYVVPKLEYGKENQDQEPLLDRTLYKQLMEL